MPELPEVETILRYLEPQLKQLVIQDVEIRNPKLRWMIAANLGLSLKAQKILKLSRRGKYLLIHFTTGTLIIHLGMSGSLRLVHHNISAGRHDHVDLVFSNHTILRYHDPRRFGCFLWTNGDVLSHPLLKTMGIEPLNSEFNGQYLLKKATNRHTRVKSFIMNNKILAGVGNIYASEALFLSKLHPNIRINLIRQKQWDSLAKAIKEVLASAITKGGTTLKDYVNADGKPGYFSQELFVYGRAGQTCKRCQAMLSTIRLNQRNTVFCPQCQNPTG